MATDPATTMRQWYDAELRFKKLGMSASELKKQRDAWFAKRRPVTAGKTLRSTLTQRTKAMEAIK